MKLYHATFTKNLHSIKRNGLGGIGKRRNFNFSHLRVTCLAQNKKTCLLMMSELLEYWVINKKRCRTKFPEVVILEIKLPKQELEPDLNHNESFQKRGGIDPQKIIKIHKLSKKQKSYMIYQAGID